MEDAGVIADYIGGLAHRLAFDRALARSACREVEDHLREAAAAAPTNDPGAAERWAVARFGDPRALAAELAVVSLTQDSRRTSAAAILAIAGVFVAMKGRLAWYGMAATSVRDDLQVASHIVGLIDRYAFWTAALVGIAAWLSIVGRRAGATAMSSHRRRLRRVVRLCGTAAYALLISIAADGTLTTVHALGADLSAALIPLVTMAVEVAGGGLLVSYIHRMSLRARATAALLDA